MKYSNQTLNKITQIPTYISASFSNMFKMRFNNYFYIVEPANWSTRWDGLNLSKFIEPMCTTIYPFGIKNKLIHFGYPVTPEVVRKMKKWGNRVVVTWFHINPDDPKNTLIKEMDNTLDLFHTSCTTTRDELIKLGASPDKIVVIPITIDLDYFNNLGVEEKKSLKNKLNLPKNKILIGSFQKDGVGWGDGFEPKWVKGPDIFCDVAERLSLKFDIHVLLTGPARGYMKKRLQEARITFTHKHLDYYPDINQYYQVLDLYLVTSRSEGGPKAILESMATRVPLVSTKVGMAKDIIKDGHDGFLVEINDVDRMYRAAEKILSDREIASKLTINAESTVRNYSNSKLAEEYYNKIYLKV